MQAGRASPVESQAHRSFDRHRDQELPRVSSRAEQMHADQVERFSHQIMASYHFNISPGRAFKRQISASPR